MAPQPCACAARPAKSATSTNVGCGQRALTATRRVYFLELFENTRWGFIIRDDLAYIRWGFIIRDDLV